MKEAAEIRVLTWVVVVQATLMAALIVYLLVAIRPSDVFERIEKMETKVLQAFETKGNK